MSSFGAEIRRRLKKLKKAGADIPKIINTVAEAATINAVEVATKNTPANAGRIKGTGMRSGAMAQSWATDSITKPTRGRTVLANSQAYASYVNDGHRMDRHFVPGLVVVGKHLERSPDGSGGIVVGTKTTYVKGKYIKEKAIRRYRRTVRKMLDQEIKERFK
jgi:hypothetical protein